MKISPLDIRQKVFRVRWRGYDRDETDEFLDTIREEYEVLATERTALQERLHTLERQVRDAQRREQELTNTLVTAQQVIEEMKGVAKKQADVIVREAELEAEECVRRAREEELVIHREILHLKRQRGLFVGRFRSLLANFRDALEAEEQDELAQHPQPTLAP